MGMPTYTPNYMLTTELEVSETTKMASERKEKSTFLKYKVCFGRGRLYFKGNNKEDMVRKAAQSGNRLIYASLNYWPDCIQSQLGVEQKGRIRQWGGGKTGCITLGGVLLQVRCISPHKIK